MALRPPTGQSPDWYPDPEGSSRRRWWDGSGWTDDYRDKPIEHSDDPSTPPTRSDKPKLFDRIVTVVILGFLALVVLQLILLQFGVNL